MITSSRQTFGVHSLVDESMINYVACALEQMNFFNPLYCTQIKDKFCGMCPRSNGLFFCPFFSRQIKDKLNGLYMRSNGLSSFFTWQINNKFYYLLEAMVSVFKCEKGNLSCQLKWCEPKEWNHTTLCHNLRRHLYWDLTYTQF